MTIKGGIAGWQTGVLWTALLMYATSRVCQMYPERFGILSIVVMQVVPPAVFAVVHGSIQYGVRGMSAFTGFCLGVGAVCESISLRTGFPFGHYSFTGFMGPKVHDLPILLVLAYLGIGYCSWVLSLLILGYRDKPLVGIRVVALPLLASGIMLAWDVSMDAVWSTLDRAWIWHDGGPFFGVPISNFLGWYFTAYLFYQGFALYWRSQPRRTLPASRSYWRTAILCYAVCAFGNLFIFRPGLFSPVGTDGTGKQWGATGILAACTVVSLLGMGPAVVLAWRRLRAEEVEICAGDEFTLQLRMHQ